MYYNIFSAVLIVFALIGILKGIIKSRRVYWVEAIVRVAISVVSSVVTALFSLKLALMISDYLVNWLMSTHADENIKGIMTEVASAPELLSFMISLLITPLLFTIIFLLCKLILNLILRRLLTKLILLIAGLFTKKNYIESSYAPFRARSYRKFNIASALICALCSLISYVVIFVPFFGTLELIAHTAKITFTENTTVTEISDAITENVATKAILDNGGRQIYSAMITHEVNGEKVSLETEVEFLAELANAALVSVEEDVTPERTADAFREVGKDAARTSIIPLLATDFINAANDYWVEGRDFYGIAAPSLGEGYEDITTAILLTDATYDSMREDISVLFNIVSTVIESEVIPEDGEISIEETLGNEALMHDLSAEILSSKRFSPVLATVLDISIETVAEALGTPDTSDNEIVVTRHMLKCQRGEITDISAEADAIANILSSIASLAESSSNGASIDLVKTIGPLLDAMYQSETIGKETTQKLLVAILQSEAVLSNLNMSLESVTELTNTINASVSEKNTYTVQLSTLSNTALILMNTKDQLSSSDAVIDLITDITPESADTLKQLATADTVAGYGVPEENAENVSGFVSGMLDNMSTAKENGMSEEQYQQEADAISDMMNIAINAQGSEAETFFGEESVTGITATDYVDRVLDSTIMTNTILQNVYGSSSAPTLDPLATGATLTETESDELVASLDTKWQAQLAKGQGDAQNTAYLKTLISVAAMVNVEVTLDPSGHIVQQ